MQTEPLYVELALAIEAAADGEARTIEGVLVPYGETADLGIGVVRFLPGSITTGRDRTPLLLGHDTNQPVGVLADNAIEERDGAAFGRFAIDTTAAGDDALVQAASGSRSGISVGAMLDEWTQADDGVIDVTAARLYEASLVAIPAYAGADVSRVAATIRFGVAPRDAIDQAAAIAAALTNGRSTTVETETIPEAEATAEVPVQHTPAILATAREPQLQAGDGGRFVQAMIRAANGERDAIAYVEAALSVLDTSDVPGLVPRNYTNEILGGITVERALADRVARRSPMPDSGMTITKPRWTALPNGGWVAENAPIPSNAPAVGTNDVDILEWAWGVAMSYALATRSNPDALDAFFRAAVEDYYGDVEQKLADLLMASDTASAAGATLGAGIAQYFGAVSKQAGTPNLLVVSGDIYGDLFDALVMVPVMQGASGFDAGFRGTIGGLEVVVSPYLPDGTEIITRRGVIELRETNPVRLTANVIGALQVELGVTAFASFDLEYPGAVISLTPGAGAPAGTSAAKRSAAKTRKG